MSASLSTPLRDRLALIEHARRAVMQGGGSPQELAVETWIERSWRRCLAGGQRPEQKLGFDMVAAQARRRVLEANQPLVHAARPVLDRLARALASTRYFAILTDGRGVVIDAHGPIDRSDRRADLITRVGVDLSERAVGTTAIGAALAELQPVWLHRGEHFFDDTSVYSCAGAPLFGPDGRCVGMLDLTGIDAAERPELKHLVAQSARSIENALTLALPHKLLLRLNWPGRSLGGDDDGLVALDVDGWVRGSNHAARQMVPQLAADRRAGPLQRAVRATLGSPVRPGPAQLAPGRPGGPLVVRPAAAGAAAVVRPAGRPGATARAVARRGDRADPQGGRRRARQRAAGRAGAGHQPRHGVPQTRQQEIAVGPAGDHCPALGKNSCSPPIL